MDAYVYRSETAHGTRTFIATCPVHGRDLCIHPDERKAAQVASSHRLLFHGPIIITLADYGTVTIDTPALTS